MLRPGGDFKLRPGLPPRPLLDSTALVIEGNSFLNQGDPADVHSTESESRF